MDKYRTGRFRREYILSFFIAFCFVVPVYAADMDNDGLSDELEAVYYTDPLNADTDGDGYPDGTEIVHDFSPHAGDGTRFDQYDYDTDGLNDWQERWFGSDIGIVDTDGDGISDYEEVMNGLDPRGTTTTFYREIVVDVTKQRLYIYVDGIKIHNYPVSTGNPWTPTPVGAYEIQRKIPVARYVGIGYDLPNVQWNLQFIPHYFIHGAYWHNDFGIRTHSHGCVNMRTEDVAVLYKFIDIGVPVTVTGTTPIHRNVGS